MKKQSMRKNKRQSFNSKATKKPTNGPSCVREKNWERRLRYWPKVATEAVAKLAYKSRVAELVQLRPQPLSD